MLKEQNTRGKQTKLDAELHIIFIQNNSFILQPHIKLVLIIISDRLQTKMTHNMAMKNACTSIE